MRIGIFDSGIGGEYVASTIRRMMPTAEIITVNDHDNVPYGIKEPDDIVRLTKAAIQPLIDVHCNMIVIACNTASTVAISSLRLSYPDEHFIGIEPMVKPAALITKTRCIAVCATPRTLESDRYRKLKHDWADGIAVFEPDCRSWATLIENGQSDKINITALIKSLLAKNVDVIVLGCTHYHWLIQQIVDAAPEMKVLEPSDSIVERVRSLVETTDY